MEHEFLGLFVIETVALVSVIALETLAIVLLVDDLGLAGFLEVETIVPHHLDLFELLLNGHYFLEGIFGLAAESVVGVGVVFDLLDSGGGGREDLAVLAVQVATIFLGQGLEGQSDVLGQ